MERRRALLALPSDSQAALRKDRACLLCLLCPTPFFSIQGTHSTPSRRMEGGLVGLSDQRQTSRGTQERKDNRVTSQLSGHQGLDPPLPALPRTLTSYLFGVEHLYAPGFSHALFQTAVKTRDIHPKPTRPTK